MHILDIKEPPKKMPRPNAFLYDYQGKKVTLNDLVKISSISKQALRRRLKIGMDIEKAVSLPEKSERLDARKYMFLGQARTIAEIAKLTRINKETLARRMTRLKDINKAVYGARESTRPKKINESFCSSGTPKKPPTIVDFDAIDIEDTWAEQLPENKKELIRAKKQRENDLFEAMVLKELMGRDCYE